MSLYLKTIFASLAILFIILLGFYLSFSHSIQLMSQKALNILTLGNISAIEEVVITLNEQAEAAAKLSGADFHTRANSKLKKIFSHTNNAPVIVDINSLPFTKREKEQLLMGDIIYKNEKNLMFLTYSIHDVYAYKRIFKSSYVLKMTVGASMNDIVKSATYLMSAFILNRLNTLPMSEWNEALNKFQIQYQIPLKLSATNNKNISINIRNKLIYETVAYENPRDNKPITTIYFKIPNSDQILSVGPLNYPYFSLQYSNIQIYFVITITLWALCSVLTLTWLFSKNSAKIQKLTQQYSQGNFDYDVHLTRFSTLRGIYENVVSMGKQINLLIQSQQNMARFVAHEVRTPLYTMQLAVESLRKINCSQEQEHLDSIEEDIQELNQLIGTFLLYSQGATHELKLNKETLNLRQWLINLLKPYQSFTVNVSFKYQQSDDELISFDPALCYHALTNLLSNALKFAYKEILVRLEYQNQLVIIHVDDDGPGVPKPDREKIFEPFATLNPSDTTGKHIGLGLSITKSIIILHQGALLINDSNRLKGACFSICLPKTS